MKKYAILLLLLGLMATFANPQFPIRIPKIKIPKIEQPTKDTAQPPSEPSQPDQTRGPDLPQTSKSVSQTTKMSSEAVLLDSMTYFSLEQVRVDYKVVGWHMRPNFKLIGDIPNRSALRIFVKRNGKELLDLRCEIEEDAVRRCVDEKKVVKELGMLDVEVNFINGDTDEERPLRTYKIDVHRTEKFNDYADFFVNRHPDVAVGYLSVEGKNPFVIRLRADREKGSTVLHLNTVISRDHDEKYRGGSYLRCSVNGQPFKLKQSIVAFRQKEGSVFATYESRAGGKGPVYKDYLKFALQQIQLPLSLGSETTLTNDISRTPGKWECSIIGEADRETYRTIRFTVDARGQIVTHPEQRNGNVVFGDWEWMIYMDIPAGGSPIDHRLKRSPEMGLFHGIPWSTPEGKAMAERVPNKGNPFPLPAK